MIGLLWDGDHNISMLTAKGQTIAHSSLELNLVGIVMYDSNKNKGLYGYKKICLH